MNGKVNIATDKKRNIRYFLENLNEYVKLSKEVLNPNTLISLISTTILRYLKIFGSNHIIYK